MVPIINLNFQAKLRSLENCHGLDSRLSEIFSSVTVLINMIFAVTYRNQQTSASVMKHNEAAFPQTASL